MFHWLAHILGLNHGKVYTWWDDKDLMIGFKCSKCGDISGVHKSDSRLGLRRDMKLKDPILEVYERFKHFHNC
jgi:hypothetical protein